MGVGSGPGVGGTAQPPQIREFETTAFVENLKKNVLAMLPADTYEVIPWTQREHDEVFKYRSEAGRPMLHPLMFLRTSLNPEIVEERVWQPYYEALLDAFPPEIKEKILYEMALPFTQRDTDYVALNYLLSGTAKAISWLLGTTRPIEPGTGEAILLMLNMALPYVAMRGALDQTTSVLLATNQWIQSKGANYVGFDAITAYLLEAEKTVAEFNVLRGLIERGEEPPEVRNRLIQMNEKMERLRASFYSLGTSSELLLLGASIDSLATLISSWALKAGSSSLFLSSEIALNGIGQKESTSGILGGSLNELFDQFVSGLLASMTSGPQTEVQELTTLHSELTALRD